MPKIYRISKAGVKLFYKIRHRRGHGIHSPFVYSLITKVIEEKIPYYAYQEIKNYISNYPQIEGRITKQNMLSFRLVNYFGSKNILEIGAGYGINTLFLTAPSSAIKCHCVEFSPSKYTIGNDLYKKWDRGILLHTDNLPQPAEKQDCIYVDLKNYNHPADEFKTYLLNLTGKHSFIIVKGIRTNKRGQLLWKSLVNDERVTVSLDLFSDGIVFFDPKLYKRNYKISF